MCPRHCCLHECREARNELWVLSSCHNGNYDYDGGNDGDDNKCNTVDDYNNVMVNNVGNSIYNDYNEAVYDKGEYDNGNGESIDHKKCYCY